MISSMARLSSCRLAGVSSAVTGGAGRLVNSARAKRKSSTVIGMAGHDTSPGAEARGRAMDESGPIGFGDA